VQDAVHAPRPELRAIVVELLANIRFFDEAAVNHFLAQHADPDLTTRVLSATPSLRATDTFNLLDDFINTQLISSEEFRAKVAAGYRRAGTAKSLSQGIDKVMVFILNMIAGREALQMDGGG
jgi:hypothetical protein